MNVEKKNSAKRVINESKEKDLNKIDIDNKLILFLQDLANVNHRLDLTRTTINNVISSNKYIKKDLDFQKLAKEKISEILKVIYELDEKLSKLIKEELLINYEEQI